MEDRPQSYMVQMNPIFRDLQYCIPCSSSAASLNYSRKYKYCSYYLLSTVPLIRWSTLTAEPLTCRGNKACGRRATNPTKSTPYPTSSSSSIRLQFLSTYSKPSRSFKMSKYETELHDFPNIFSLKGKVVVVTGGSRGLGLHAASGYPPLPSPLKTPS